MATFDYQKARQTAERLINKFGNNVTLLKEGEAGGEDAFGDPIPGTPDILVSGTITPKLDYSFSEIDGSFIQMGDCYAYFHSDTAPEVGMTVTLNGDNYRVVDITDLTSVGGVNVYRKLQLRR